MVISIVISNCSYMIVAPFMPLEFEQKGVSKELVGIVFAAYPIGVILTSPLIGKHLEYTGRSFWIIGGLVFMGILFIGFGLLSQATNPSTIFWVALICRFFQGIANAGC